MADEDGLIGADVFGSYLIDIDIPEQKLRLSPLPKRPDETAAVTGLDSEGESRSNPEDKAESSSDQNAASANGASQPVEHRPPRPRLPKDRYVAPEMADWTPVFRFGHELLIRTRVNDSQPMLFLIDTGASVNFISTRAARQVTKVGSDFQYSCERAERKCGQRIPGRPGNPGLRPLLSEKSEHRERRSVEVQPANSHRGIRHTRLRAAAHAADKNRLPRWPGGLSLRSPLVVCPVR